MRIITGKFKGRKLVFPKSKDIRPAMDKVRESIFNVLGDVVQEADVLDLFAGCGSLGFEALSRGAKSATFVDNHHQAIESIKTNADLLKVKPQVRIIPKLIITALPILSHAKESFNLIFIDPPYDRDFLRKTLREIVEFDILRPFGWIVIEHSKRESPEPSDRYAVIKESKFGATHLTFLFRKG